MSFYNSKIQDIIKNINLNALKLNICPFILKTVNITDMSKLNAQNSTYEIVLKETLINKHTN